MKSHTGRLHISQLPILQKQVNKATEQHDSNRHATMIPLARPILRMDDFHNFRRVGALARSINDWDI